MAPNSRFISYHYNWTVSVNLAIQSLSLSNIFYPVCQVYPLMFPFLKIAAPHGAATCNCCDAVPLIRLDLLLNSLGDRMKTAISYAVIHWSYTNCFPCNHTFITLTCMCRDQKNKIYLLYLHLPIPCTCMYECTCEQGKFECCFCAKFEWS